MDKRTDNGLLNVRKTAQLLDVHPNTLRNWTNQGLLPCYTVNSRGDRRFRPEDIEDFLERHRRILAQPVRFFPNREASVGAQTELGFDGCSQEPVEARAAKSTEDQLNSQQDSLPGEVA